MPVRLAAPLGPGGAVDALPLAYEVGERLTGTIGQAQYEMHGRAVSGAALDAALRAEGIGPHDIEVSGLYAPPLGFGGAPGALLPWRAGATVVGTLDPDTLGRVVHALARAWAHQWEGRAEGTPPEVYVMAIRVNAPAPVVAPAPEPEPRRKPTRRQRPEEEPERRTVYRDTATGRLVSRATWERSRRAIRAHAKRSGRAPGRGRFVRQVVTVRRRAK